MNLKNIVRVFILVCLLCSFANPLSSSKFLIYHHYSNFSQYWNYPVILDGFVGGGGGSLTANITNDILTVTFSSGFSANKLKSGNVVYLATSPSLPNMELGFLNLKNGTTVYNNAVKVSVISNYIYFTHTANHNQQQYTLASGSFQIDLSTYGNSGLTGSKNYIYTTIAKEGTTNLSTLTGDQKLENITYFDGLGRPLQQIGIRHTGGIDQEDLVTHIAYDQFGRQIKEFLPYPDNGNNKAFRTGDLVLKTQEYYKANYSQDFPDLMAPYTNPYFETKYENSPLNRPLKTGAPGTSWIVKFNNDPDRTIKFDYKTNISNEVRLYKVSLTTTFVPGLIQSTTSYFQAGQLFKTINKDENWTPASGKNHTTEEFKDKQGRVVLKRTYANTDLNNNGITTDPGEQQVPYDTYYVYDDYGNLTYVIPPQVNTGDGISAIELSELCYQYRYDNRKRLIEKKIPGKGTQANWEAIVYNKLDQPIMTQDPNLKTLNQWLFTKHDAFGRIVYTGLVNRAATRATLQAEADNNIIQFEERSASRTLGGTSIYYTNNAYPGVSYPASIISEVHTENYFDTYLISSAQAGITVPATNTVGETISTATKGLLTVSKVRILGSTSWITSVSAYEKKGRLVWIKSINPYLSTTDLIETDIDFIGNVLATKTTHSRTGNTTIITTDNFTYDHVNRLKKHTQTLNGRTEVIADNIYSKTGELISKGVGNLASSSARLQTVNYSYNIRGWLKGINNEGGSNSLITLGSGDIFGFQINYNSPTVTNNALFNGNISQTLWRTKSMDQTQRHYFFTYDALNRITDAIDNSSNYDEFGITYDKNGNIKRLKRDGKNHSTNNTFGLVDDLSYTYGNNNIDNKLMRVDDATGISEGFKNGINTGNDYFYDQNGNLTSDANKGIPINGISYNHLNLPTSITLPGGTISYTYDATGIKLQKKIVQSGQLIKYTFYAGNFMYGRSGDSGAGTLEFFNHPEGYVSYDGGQFNYVYNYLDHLGNVRLSYTDANGNGSIETGSTYSEIIQEKNYYPFGLAHQGYNTYGSPLGNAAAKRYGFGGKELQNENISGNYLDWYDVSARNYDPALGRWMNLDPLAEQAPDWTPYRFAFNNPLNFVDPDGLYEWRVNSKTGEYKRFGDKGGNEEQYIFFNDDKEATNVMKGETIYVGAAAHNRYKDGEVSYAVSTKDLWTDLPDEYQGAYTRGDLVDRYQAQQKGGDKYDMIRGQEAQGLARRDQIWNNKDLKNHLIEVYGNDSGLSLAAATGMLQTIVDFGTSIGPSPKASGRASGEFSPVFKPNAQQLSNNSWIRFLQTNQGKYKGLGKNWIYQASKDYQALKAAGKL